VLLSVVIMVLPVILSIDLQREALTADELDTLRRELQQRVMQSRQRCWQPVINSVHEGDLVTAQQMWDMCQPAANPDVGLYNDEVVLGGDYSFIAIKEPNNVYGQHGNLLGVHIEQPEMNMNDMLMGPAGSGSLVHLDCPSPVSVRILTVYGRKEVVCFSALASEIPAGIRGHSHGAAPYTAEEWEELKEWVLGSGLQYSIAEMEPGMGYIQHGISVVSFLTGLYLQVTCVSYRWDGGMPLVTWLLQ
jgi:hypothetical protein